MYKRTDVNGEKYYGKHLMITASSCADTIMSMDTISEFVKCIVSKIDMVAYGDLVIARFGEGIELGISAVQLITTSAITIHTNDKYRDMYLDIFSCKWFDEEIVIDLIRMMFSPMEIKDTIILRK